MCREGGGGLGGRGRIRDFRSVKKVTARGYEEKSR